MEQIEIEKKREKDLKEQIKDHGELLTIIRAALQSMNMMLLRIKLNGKGPKKLVKDEKGKEPMITDDKEDAEERDELLAEVEEMDTDGKKSYNY